MRLWFHAWVRGKGGRSELLVPTTWSYSMSHPAYLCFFFEIEREREREELSRRRSEIVLGSSYARSFLPKTRRPFLNCRRAKHRDNGIDVSAYTNTEMRVSGLTSDRSLLKGLEEM